MWHTPEGDRKLKGAERRLFINGLIHILEQMEEQDPEDVDFHSKIIRQINPDDWWFVFMLVAEQLLGDGPDPDLRAWNEAVVFEIYQALDTEIQIEVERQQIGEMEGRHGWFVRKLAHDTIKQFQPPKEELKDLDPDEKVSIPRVKSTNAADWEFEIEMLLDEILWDRDFLMYDTFADADPVRGKMLKEFMGIEQEYYLEPPPMITPEMKERLINFHTKLLEEHNRHYREFVKSGKIS